jgi:2,4-diaminopentanoate dehydrogenase
VTTRVIQWATGPVGSVQLAEVIDNPEFDLSASKACGFDANTDDIVALVETGKSVISVTSYAHLPTLGSTVDDRIRKACVVGRSRFCPAGEHPGFMLRKGY